MHELQSTARPLRPRAFALAELRAPGPMVLAVALATASLVAAAALTSTLVWLALLVPAIAAVVACIRRPLVGVIAVAAFLPFNDVVAQILGPGTVEALAVGAVKDVLLLAITAAAIFRARGESPPYPGALRAWLIVVLGIGAVAGVMTGDVLQALYGWRNDFEPLLLLAVVPLIVRPKDARSVLTTVVIAGEAAAAIAIATHQIGLSWLLGLKLDLAPGAALPTAYFSAGSITPRAFSPYVGPNELGLACVLVLAVIIHRTDWSRKRRNWLAVLPLVALLISASRSAWLGLGVLVVFEVVRQLRSRQYVAVRLATVALAVGALAGGVALLIGGGDASIGGHQASLLQSLNLLLAHPLGLGTGTVGPRAARFATSSVNTESFLLLIALEAGVVALFCYGGVMIAAGLTLVRERVTPNADGDLLMLGVAAMLASLPGQVGLPTLQDGAVSWLLWIIVAVSLSHALQARRGIAPDHDPSSAQVPPRTPVGAGR
ncbi:MAG: hypothetical protein ACREN2_07855 [Candidatus Dormibacteria bacterium]